MNAPPHGVPDARSLFAAARVDAPEPHEREAMYRQVAVTTGLAAGAAVVASIAPAASVAERGAAAGAKITAGSVGTALSLKLLVLGAALGAALTVLAVLVTMGLADPGVPVVRDAAVREARTHDVAAGASPASSGKRTRDPDDAAGVAARAAPRLAVEDGTPRPLVSSPSPVVENAPSDLAEEARLLTAARNALVAGDAPRALLLVQATRRLGARSLEPEELGLEARALRALGRADDAAATELVLKRRYPESALAR